MVRTTVILLAVAFLALAGFVPAADNPPDDKAKADVAPVTGNWKVILPFQGGNRPLWLVKLDFAQGKWSSSVSATQSLPETTIEKVAVTGDTLSFNLKLGGDTLPFEIKVPKEQTDKMLGTVLLEKKANPVQLEKTTIKSLDSYEVGKEVMAKQSGTAEVVRAGLDLLQGAKAKKAKKDEVKLWAEKATQAAELYGPRLYRDTVLRIAELLGSEDDFADLGVEYARMSEKLLTPKDKPVARKHVLELLATALENAGKKDEAKEISERAKNIDTSLKPEPFTGRKGLSDRVVLVELFTGAQCPPCVAADLAFDALGKAYKPTDVILLQYHLHIPRPDPLTNPDTEARMKFYGDVVDGTPAILFNGKPGAPGGGVKDDAADKYDEYTAVIDPLLEESAKLKLKATATQKGSKVDIKAEVSEVAKPSDELRLRLALVEEKVDYTGTNKIAEHHQVVRALPGGADGLAVKEKSAKQSATVDLEELKKSLKDYLDKFAEKKPFPTKDQPLELKKLKVVAFVQDDATGEVLQAVQVDVKAAE
jgi:hypothetical protein